MRLFRYWTKEQAVEAILAIEEGMSSGAQSISYPAAGSVAYTTPEASVFILTHLYRHVDRLEGRPIDSDRPKFITMISKRAS